MKITKTPDGLEINVSTDDFIELFLKKALKKVGNKKDYTYSSAYASNFRIDVQFIKTFSKKESTARSLMFERASKINFFDFIEEFRLSATVENQRMISQFCNALAWCERDRRSLKEMLEEGKAHFLKFRGVGSGAVELFEIFLKSKKYEFAIWSGKEWI